MGFSKLLTEIHSFDEFPPLTLPATEHEIITVCIPMMNPLYSASWRCREMLRKSPDFVIYVHPAVSEVTFWAFPVTVLGS